MSQELKMQQLKDMFEAHVESDKENFSAIREDGKEIKNDIKTIKENHLYHIEKDINSIKVRIAYYAGGITAVGWALNHFFPGK